MTITPFNTLLLQISAALRSKGSKLATAESCTGGALAAALTAHEGASHFYLGGIISYANTAKMDLLGVDPEGLGRQGAVSQIVAEQMALGALGCLKANYALATTGIAGPGGGSEDKAVGTVWIAVAHPQGIHSQCLHLKGDRTSIIAQTVETVLTSLMNILGTTEESEATQSVNKQ